MAAERPIKERAKSNNVRQAAALLDYLLLQAPDELAQAWVALDAKGSGWTRRVKQSLKRLAVISTDLHERLRRFHADEV